MLININQTGSSSLFVIVLAWHISYNVPLNQSLQVLRIQPGNLELLHPVILTLGGLLLAPSHSVELLQQISHLFSGQAFLFWLRGHRQFESEFSQLLLHLFGYVVLRARF